MLHALMHFCPTVQRLRSYRQNVEQMVSVDIFRGGEGGGTEIKVFFFFQTSICTYSLTLQQ